MRLKKESDYNLWILYLAISLLILGVDYLGWTSGIRTLGEKAINPVSMVVKNISTTIKKPVQMIKFISSGPQKILDLETRYAEAVVALEELSSLREENKTLKKFLGNSPDEKYVYLPATVVGGSDEIVISSGSNSGVRPKDTVISASNTLIGQVSRVSTFTSWVKTPFYLSNKIPIIIGPNKISSILEGTSSKAEAFVDQSEVVNIGDFISTSGVNGEYLPNIIIGRVSLIEPESADIYKKIKVDLFENTDNTVLVVKESR